MRRWNFWLLLAFVTVGASGCGDGHDADDDGDVSTTVDGPASGGISGGAAGGIVGGAGNGGGAGTGANPYAYLREGGIYGGQEPAVWDALPYTSIRLERHGCFGGCPVYSVELTRGSGYGAGRAEYTGELYVDRAGSFDGEIDIFSYGYLCQLLDELGFAGMDENYAAQWTDDSTVVVQATTADGTHRVQDYGRQGPPQLFALQLSIDATANLIEWTER